MREELMKKFAEDDRLEQLNEHKRRLKVGSGDFGSLHLNERWHFLPFSFTVGFVPVFGTTFVVEFVVLCWLN